MLQHGQFRMLIYIQKLMNRMKPIAAFVKILFVRETVKWIAADVKTQKKIFCHEHYLGQRRIGIDMAKSFPKALLSQLKECSRIRPSLWLTTDQSIGKHTTFEFKALRG